MRHIFTLIAIFLFCFGKVAAQNLVINPSFEQINVTCSGLSGAGYTNLINWYNPDPLDTCSTPDWFSTCLSNFFPTSAPQSWLGYQAPRTGDAYAGMILYDATTNAYREYVEGKLSSPLVAGQTYCVSFYVSLADTVPYSVSNIGVYFSSSLVQFPVSHCNSPQPLPVTPQLQWTGGVLNNDSAWVRLQWQYTATGGELYFVLGNFNNNANTTVTNTGGTGIIHPFAYYFVDDVSVVPGICCDAGIMGVAAQCSNGNPITLSANTAGGTWSGTGITSASAGTFSPQVAGVGTHTVTYTLPCGASSTLTIVVNNCMEVCIDPVTGNLTVSGGTGGYQWQNSTVTQNCSACLVGCNFPPGCAVNVTTWTTFATGAAISPPANLPVKVVDNSGQSLILSSLTGIPQCTTQPTCNVSVSVTNLSPSNCGNNGSVTVAGSGGTAPYAYSWSNGQATSNISGLTPGSYTCYVGDALHCYDTLTVNVTGNAPISVQMTVLPVNCAGDKTGQVTANPSNGVAPYTYSWNTGQSTATITGLAAGTYTCTVTGSNGCTTTVSATVTQPPVFQASGSSTPANGSANGTATANPTGGVAPYTYTWATTPPQYTQTITGLQPGAYTCQVKDANGCTTNFTVSVEETSSIQPENIGIAHFSLAPNPNQGLFTLHLTLAQAGSIRLAMYDNAGREIFGKQTAKQIEHQHQFDFQTVAKGVYWLSISTEKGSMTDRIVIE